MLLTNVEPGRTAAPVRAGEGLEVWSLDVQQVDAVVMAPAVEDPQIRRVTPPCRVGVASDERRNGDTFGDHHRVVIADTSSSEDSGGGFGVGHGGLLE